MLPLSLRVGSPLVGRLPRDRQEGADQPASIDRDFARPKDAAQAEAGQLMAAYLIDMKAENGCLRGERKVCPGLQKTRSAMSPRVMLDNGMSGSAHHSRTRFPQSCSPWSLSLLALRASGLSYGDAVYMSDCLRIVIQNKPRSLLSKAESRSRHLFPEIVRTW